MMSAIHNDVDLASVSQEYRAALSDLTFNSRPIITNLTIIAQENLHAAIAIVRIIEEQIKNAHPKHKLPVIYLLDSIVKNIGGVYKELFSKNLYATFTNAFEKVDPETRKSLQRLLKTWNAQPNGQPIFPQKILSSISSFIQNQALSFSQAGNADTAFHISQPSPHSATNRIMPGAVDIASFPKVQSSISSSFTASTTPEVTSGMLAVNGGAINPLSLCQEIDMLFAQRGPALAVSQIQALNQLQSLIKAGSPFNPTQCVQLKHQLAELWTSTANVVAPKVTALALKPVSSTSAPLLSTIPTLAAVPQPEVIPNNTSHLMNELFKFGFLGTTNSISSLPSSGTAAVVTPLQENISLTNDKQTVSEVSKRNDIKYVSDIGEIRFVNEDINRKRDRAFLCLYDALELKCKQCGFRYPGTEEGKKKMDAHLDWHFRHNRRMKDKGKRVMSRNWYCSTSDWIKSLETDLSTEKTPAFFDFSSNGKLAETKDFVEEEPCCVMPHDFTQKVCPVCKESFVSHWSDEEEEWLLKNAILINGVVYHGPCYLDLSKPTGSPNISPSLLGKRKAVDTGTTAEKMKKL